MTVAANNKTKGFCFRLGLLFHQAYIKMTGPIVITFVGKVKKILRKNPLLDMDVFESDSWG